MYVRQPFTKAKKEKRKSRLKKFCFHILFTLLSSSHHHTTFQRLVGTSCCLRPIKPSSNATTTNYNRRRMVAHSNLQIFWSVLLFGILTSKSTTSWAWTPPPPPPGCPLTSRTIVTTTTRTTTPHCFSRVLTRLFASPSSPPDPKEEIFCYDFKPRYYFSSQTNNTSTTKKNNFLDDLTPPPVNFARDSILFSDNPATRKNNAMTLAWTWCTSNLPPILTGCWPWRDTRPSKDDPFGSLYNMCLVRIPTIAIGCVYLRNLLEDHPLIMDLGQGAFEMSPIVVLTVLAFILA